MSVVGLRLGDLVMESEYQKLLRETFIKSLMNLIGYLYCHQNCHKRGRIRLPLLCKHQMGLGESRFHLLRKTSCSNTSVSSSVFGGKALQMCASEVKIGDPFCLGSSRQHRTAGRETTSAQCDSGSAATLPGERANGETQGALPFICPRRRERQRIRRRRL